MGKVLKQDKHNVKRRFRRLQQNPEKWKAEQEKMVRLQEAFLKSKGI